jgi:hypothetical protein
MKSIRIIGTGNHPDDVPKRRAVAPEPRAIRELRVQLHHMGKAAEPFLTGEARKTYWAKAWELLAVHAATRIEGNRKQFYGLRLAAVTSAIIVPSLVGLNLSGTGGSAVRWLTFTLSLIAALSTAILTLFRFGDRWLMYRALSNSLLSAGWALVNSPPGDAEAWTRFTTATEAARARYNTAYQTAVILAAQPKADDHSDSQE